MAKKIQNLTLCCVLCVLTGCAAPQKIPEPSVFNPLETGRAFLVGDEEEGLGYGLYSYMLFGSPPTETTRERYLRLIEAFLEIPEADSLEKYIPRKKLNITYMPLDSDIPSDTLTVEWVLQHYNYVRARVLIRKLPGEHRDGPYIISMLHPLSRIETFPEHYLYQDLSSSSPKLVRVWTRVFLNQAAQERFWEENTMEKWVVTLRDSISIAAEGLEKVDDALSWWKESLKEWVRWK